MKGLERKSRPVASLAEIAKASFHSSYDQIPVEVARKAVLERKARESAERKKQEEQKAREAAEQKRKEEQEARRSPGLPQGGAQAKANPKKRGNQPAAESQGPKKARMYAGLSSVADAKLREHLPSCTAVFSDVKNGRWRTTFKIAGAQAKQKSSAGQLRGQLRQQGRA